MNVEPISASGTNFNGLVKLGKVNKYYPFAKETEKEINDFVNANKEKLGNIKVMDALPFTKQDMLLYAKNRLNITRTRMIDKHMTEKDLNMFQK